MKEELTAVRLQAIKPPATGRLDIGDAKQPGLILRVTYNGAYSWCVRYCPKGGSQKRATIGHYRTSPTTPPLMSLADARSRTKDIVAAAARGIDLLEQEDAVRRADLARREEEKARSRSLNRVVAEYIEKYAKVNQRRWILTERMFEQHVLPKLGGKPVVDLRRADIIELLDDLQHKKGLGAQVNRIHAALKAALNFAVEREYLDANPAAAVKKQFKGEVPRERVLTDDELKAIWLTADALKEPSRGLVKMMILTGQRRDEVRCLPWAELDMEASLWTLPASRNKGKREHVVPLSDEAKAVLEALPKLGDEFVFTTGGKRPYAGQKRLKDILDRESKVVDWTFHDIRRTVASGLASLRISHDVIGRVLNHAKTDVTARHYNRHDYLEEKAAALAAWGRHVTAVVTDALEGRKVIALKARRKGPQ